MDVIDSTTAWKDRAFYFCGKLERPVEMKVWHFRSEEEYDTEDNPETLAMTLVHSLVKCIGKPSFLALLSDASGPTALRSKKGVLWEHKGLKQLPHTAFEIDCGHGETRLGAIVELSDFNFNFAASALLNWGRGMIILSTDALSVVKKRAEQWASKNAADVLAFDYDAIASSLHQDATLGVLRYLPPCNSRQESIVVVAEENFVGGGACECINSIAQAFKQNRR